MHPVLLLDEVLRIILDHIDHDPNRLPAFKTFYRLATVCRAWKDPAYRATLSEEEQAALPLNPAGIAALKTAMPHVDLSEFEQNPEVDRIGDVYTVNAIVQFIEHKLQAA